MKQQKLIELATIRTTIGYLGEKDQYNWWPSKFFVKESESYLAPVFGKTAMLSRFHGVSEAATIVHDKHIGVGKNVFHLFRLPELRERELHELFAETEVISSITEMTTSPKAAEDYLEQFADNSKSKKTGPFHVGAINDIEKSSTLKVIAQNYLDSFKSGSKSFPFFSEDK